MDGVDLDGRINGLGDDTGPGNAGAPAQGQHHYVNVRKVLDNFQGRCSYAGDEQGLVHGMDVAVSLLPGQPLAMLPGVIEGFAVEYQLCP